MFERHRSSSANARTSSAGARRARQAMQKTTEGYVAMVDGYNRIVVDFNEENAERVAEMEHELPRKEFEIAEAWVTRFYEKYNRFPNQSYFRYSSPKEHFRFGSRSPKNGPVGSGHLKT